MVYECSMHACDSIRWHWGEVSYVGVLFLHLTLSLFLCFPERFLDHFINRETGHIIVIFIKGCTAII